jgi:hypothetical protein
VTGNVLGSVRTGADGGYAFEDLVEGSYASIASGFAPAAAGIRLSPGEELEHHVVLGGRA